ncbi:probable beta-D-xylosidase 7 [Beta vulgaris subsp. vulgaris]|uniref:probable beta-D-xylosidase 7 n=1 Tax=Beta vulgaris subsp. vulgaris TaxID=3555 RepID=UPI0020367088|nr:probable beta-D-xylosidase 7 [Beta vulgaris subsp. vulgaris]
MTRLQRRSSGSPVAAFAALLLVAFLYVEAAIPPFGCDSSDPSTDTFAFCRVDLPIRQRAKDLVARLTFDEKVFQLVNTAPAIPRLGIPAYQWWSEALHGVAAVGRGVSFSGTIRNATSFPQVILTAASFDAHLWYRIGQAIGREARALYNEGQAKGMTFWAPNINIFRDPRWGRGQETPGEDPWVAGKYAMQFVRGLQGDSFEGGQMPGHLQASACCKHFTAYDLDRWNGFTRYRFDAQVTAQDMADTYQPPFESCIHQGRASGIMCAYNRVNGVPNCADYNLLTRTAREKWSFDGYITSDCDAVSLIHQAQGFAESPEDAVGDVLKAGMDLNCGSYLLNYTKSAVEQGKVVEAEVDRALENLFAVRMRLGLFNGNPKDLQYGSLGPADVCTQESKALALEAARQGIVLLKNKDKLLPLPKEQTFSLAVIGPNADAALTLLGNYRGRPCNSISPLQALQSYVENTIYHPGCENVACSFASIEEASNIAEAADYVVLIMGLDTTQETEGLDRLNLVLPGEQHNLIQQVARVAKRPVVLVLLCGGPVDVTFAKIDANIGGIIWAGYPGQAGGVALAEIIFGDYNPGGKLPMTWYPQQFVEVPMTDMRMRADPSSGYPGRTYKFYQGSTVFEFGDGLSYTSYHYNFITVTPNTQYLNLVGTIKVVEYSYSTKYAIVLDKDSGPCSTMKFIATIGVTNEGDVAGKHPVLLYARKENAINGSPIKKLVGFESVYLNAGEQTEIQFELNPCKHLSRADQDGVMVVEEGIYSLIVGDQEFPITIQLTNY